MQYADILVAPGFPFLLRPKIDRGASFDFCTQRPDRVVLALTFNFVRRLNDHRQLHASLGGFDEGLGDVGNRVDGETDERDSFLSRIQNDKPNGHVFEWSFYEDPNTDSFLYEACAVFAGEKGDENRLPRINEGETPPLKGVTPRQHFTEPPPRFSEASLVKKMEELGIGRPSTYASTLSVLRERNYVHMDKKRFIPDDKGHVVTAFLESFFGRWVEYDFTANLEEDLDRISAGQLEWKSVLRDFWNDFYPKTEEVLAVSNTEVLENLNEHLKAHVFKETEPGVDPRKCQSCDNGRLSLKTGRFGAFIGCSNYPECRFTRQLTGDTKGNGATAEGPKVLGQDPETGLDVTLREGRFGPYFQLGEQDKEDKKSKPRRASLPKDMSPDQVDFEQALKLLSLPREVGMHPETDKMITAAIGRYGPYILHDGKYASLTTTEEVFSVGVNRAVVLLAEAKNKVRRGPQALKELGEHPEDGNAVRVMDGRYGPYVKHNAVNATIPRGTDPQDVDMDMAVALLKARIAKGPAKKKARPKKKKTAKKKTAKSKSKAKAPDA